MRFWWWYLWWSVRSVRSVVLSCACGLVEVLGCVITYVTVVNRWQIQVVLRLDCRLSQTFELNGFLSILLYDTYYSVKQAPELRS